MHLFRGKIRRQLGRISRCSWGWARKWALVWRWLTLSVLEGSPWCHQPQRGSFVKLPTSHQRHLVLQDGCLVANGDVVWMLGNQMRIFSDVSPKHFLRILGQRCVTCKGIVQGWARKPFYPGVRPSQLMFVVLLRTEIMAFMGMLSGNLEWKQWRE